MTFLFKLLLGWPEAIARYLTWFGPLFARLVGGWVFMWSGWEKLNNLPAITENFVSWGVPFPQFFTPVASGVECFGGAFLLAGFLTRVSAGALGVTMIVAILAAKLGEIDSLETLLGFEEVAYLALFVWLAIAGAGPLSVDHWLPRRFGDTSELK